MNRPMKAGRRPVTSSALPSVFYLLVLYAIIALQIPSNAAPPPGYSLAWSDEFNAPVGTQPSSADWNWEVGDVGASNNELETYVNDIAHSHVIADVNATDGYALQIQATDDNGKTGVAGKYSSARMTTQGKHDLQYGFIEARIRLPYGQGIWPAFWMLGSNIGSVGWPACGEMDIMENIGNNSWLGQNESSLHGTGYSGANSLHAFYNLPTGQYFKDGYHLFQEQWDNNTVSYFVDGNLFETHTSADVGTNPWAFNHACFFIMNIAVGGSFPGNPNRTTVFPQNMLVDYVRYYVNTVPPAPGALVANAGALSTSLTWASSPKAASYNIYRSTTPGGEGTTPIVTGIASTSFTDTGLTAGTTYYYRVAAVNTIGTSAQSNEASATPYPVPTGPVSINSGGFAVSPWVADTDYSGGSSASTATAIATTSLTGTIPPQSVLQTNRWGAMTYTLPGFTPGSVHTVTLYFAEEYWTASGKRVFNVAINGSSVLSNFDIYAAAGGSNKAIQRAFSATANASGAIVIVFTNVTDNAQVNGIVAN